MDLLCTKELCGGGKTYLPRYVIVSVVQSGIRGTVYNAFDTLNRKPVILKRCQLAVLELSNLLVVKRAGCHPGLIQSLESDKLVDDWDIQFSEYGPPDPNRWSVAITKHHIGEKGSDSGTWLRNAILPKKHDNASTIMKPYFKCVAELHDKTNLVHCDIKPTNFVKSASKAGDMVLIDFELAVAEGSTVTNHGTPMYTAPELITYGVARKTSDAWSLGIMLWQVLHGKDHPYMDLPSEVVDNVYMFKQLVSKSMYDPETMWTAKNDLAKDLVNRLLCSEANRISVLDALEHPFFDTY